MSVLEDKIEHVVVLMLENRSFDSMLGALYAGRADFDGLKGNETNPWSRNGNAAVPVPIWNAWTKPTPGPMPLCIPDPDPGELWTDINMQLFGAAVAPGDQVPTMQGFVSSYVAQAAPGKTYLADAIMHYYASSDVPVLSALASAYAVCDQWHASAPCQTWPNRFFVHTGTAGGYQNNSPPQFPYAMPTVFTRFNELGFKNGWKVYFHDIPQALTLADLWLHPDHFHPYEDVFKEDAMAGDLPAYAFIEPRYFPDLTLPNDQHPPHNVLLGEQLIADVYNTLRNAPTWEKTLLVITYDEHGGCYDHVPPPLAIAPDGAPPTGPFAFDRYGVRVPAVIVSPYVAPGTILRALPGGNLPHRGPPYPFDHTSIIATLRQCFKLGEPLTARDALAPDLGSALTLHDPTNNGPAQIDPPAYVPTPAEVATALDEPLNGTQQALHALATRLQGVQGIPRVEDRIKQIEANIESFAQGLLGSLLHPTPRTAAPFVKAQTRAFLGL